LAQAGEVGKRLAFLLGILRSKNFFNLFAHKYFIYPFKEK
jgi:hypothetical protein